MTDPFRCWSKIGRSGGAQSLSLGRGCEYVGVVLHEVMHALGEYNVISFKLNRDEILNTQFLTLVPCVLAVKASSVFLNNIFSA